MTVKEIALQLTIKALEAGFINNYGDDKDNAESISNFYLDTYNAIKATDDAAAKNDTWMQK